MRGISGRIGEWKIWIDGRGQDLTDYALFAAFIVLASGAIWPVVANSIGQIFTKLTTAISGPAHGSVK